MPCCADETPSIPVIGVSATIVNRSMYRGDTLYFTDTLWQDITTGAFYTVPPGQQPSTSASVPVNLTGATIWFTAKYAVADPDERAVMRLNNQALMGVTVVNATGGQFAVTGPVLATNQFPDGETDLCFDIQYKDVTGRVFTVERGTLAILPDVTRSVT